MKSTLRMAILTVLSFSTIGLATGLGAGISSVSPNSAAPGELVTVTMTLDPDATPPPPPTMIQPDSMAIGSIVGSQVSRSGADCTATFQIPAEESAGTKNCTVNFPTPNGSVALSLTNGFTVTVGPDTPPSISTQPESQIVQESDNATFIVEAIGTPPLSYQWQKDSIDIIGAIENTYSIPQVAESDEAEYQCKVSNDYGNTVSSAATLTVSNGFPSDGYSLYSPVSSTESYLINNDGDVLHSWSSAYRPGQALYLLEDGSLMRTANTLSSTFDSGGASGRVEQYDWEGNLIWAFDYDSDTYLSHHDIEVLPNGNILMVAWERKTREEALAAGRNSSLLTDGELWADHIIEVAPSGNYGGEIVWQWHVWDHLVVNNPELYPERIDINHTLNGGADWNHINSIDYNPGLDQILVSVRNFNEIWIIDHNTSTEEAAGAAGDLLYRWGNPTAYNSGSFIDQQLFVQHDAHWIGDTLPGAGNILLFNNGQGRIDGNYSSVDEIEPPLAPDGTYTFGQPLSPVWSYVAPNPADFYAMRISGAQRQSNGNTLICEGTAGYAFEVTDAGELVWDFTSSGEMFRFERYLPTFSGLDGTGLDPTDALAHSYTIVDTGQSAFYDTTQEIAKPEPDEAFYGQDASYSGNQPAYFTSKDGKTVYDYHTGLTWTQSADLNSDGDINIEDKLTQSEAVAYAETLNAQNFGGYSDWRLPSIKEIYSLMDFRGTDPMNDDTTTLIPFIDSKTFDFGFGDTEAGERTIDAQWATTSIYVDRVMNGQQAMFGLNLVDGRIKGYPTSKLFYAYYVRGNPAYGTNDFSDNSDGTITDNATGLMWQKDDNGEGLLWSEALEYAENSEHAGYTDWRLPNAKELQSLFDYSRSPATSDSAAIDPIFNCTRITNEEGEADYPWYFTGTTHLRQDGSGSSAVYLCFGRAMGYMNGQWLDVHGAGAQRSDPKSYDTTNYTYVGEGWYFTPSPQGDAARWYNFVRLVRDAPQAINENTQLSLNIGTVTNTTVLLSWTSTSGKSYQLEGSEDLSIGSWENLGIYSANPPLNRVEITRTKDTYFYRLRIVDSTQ